jgi:hypothetical protein
MGKRHGINCGVIGNTLGTLKEQTRNMVGTKKSIKISNPTLLPSSPHPKEKRKKTPLMNACEVSLAA